MQRVRGGVSNSSAAKRASEGASGVAQPTAISLPKGGGAIRGIGEKFAANPVTGTGSTTIPVATSPGRSAFGPELALSYDSGAGNSSFGFGWSLALPAITRKTDKGLPQYLDAEESDVFILSGLEDLVPVLHDDGTRWSQTRSIDGVDYRIRRYQPRIEGLFARIERWTNQVTEEVHWRSISRDNITTMYGKTAESRIADPSDFRHIFSWLICESYDEKGTAIVYSYAAENEENIDRRQANERNRVRTANRYLKCIRYGNRTPNRNANWQATDPALLPDSDWMFEVVFDYDEGHYELLDPDPTLVEAEQHRFVRAATSRGQPWAVRPDPFSSYRAGFEVRTYRRCRRVLMFHHFPELGDEPCLVRSTEFDYADLNYAQPVTIEEELAHEGSTRFASFICKVIQSGYVRQPDGSYLKESLPPIEFAYSKSTIHEDLIEVDADSLENLPIGLDGGAYRWVDLDAEGISGILTEQSEAWFYKPNLGGGRFGPLQTIVTRPSLAALSTGRQQLLDLAGDGQLDLVEFGGPTPGFYARTQAEAWESFKPFPSLPDIFWDEPNLRFVDLSGDGHADVLITEHDVFTWHPSLAEDGFGPAERVHAPLDEEQGPQLVFADGAQSIYLADMCGDGLTDLVRIRNGEVCYWPNLGYGRFGTKVTMDNAPWFDRPEQFTQARIRLADIDGSGNNDIIYLGRDGVRLYFNESGNRWSEPRRLLHFPQVDDLSSVTVADLMGNGTACLVWSSPLPRDARRSLRYVDLMGGTKPHLLTKTVSNLGTETHVHYVSSTRFYLEDKAAGTPWITKLPFPVHVVDRVETFDRISRNRFVTRYAYHHGYFDGEEREFRGFGMVEQFDTEEFAALSASEHLPTGGNVDAASHVPPVHTKTWFHAGAFLDRDHISRQFETEYYREPGLTEPEFLAQLLPDTTLPVDLSGQEEREACRALKGVVLRQEVYALDGTDKQAHPYSVSERDYTIVRLQPRGENRHAVFFVHPRETIDYHYERDPADPRIAHALTLEVDGFGNVLKEVAIGYGRRETIRVVDEEGEEGEATEIPNPDLNQLEQHDQEKQTRILITYTENRVTKPIEAEDDHYRAPLPCETRTYELTGYTATGAAGRFRGADFVQPHPSDPDRLVHIFDSEIAYEAEPTTGKERGLIGQLRTLYRPDDLGESRNDPLALLPLGTVELLALPGETYELAFTPGLLAEVYRRPLDVVQPAGAPPPENLLPDPADVLGGQGVDRGSYVDLDADGRWWLPSGRIFFSPGSQDPLAQELAFAREHFFLPHRFHDPFGHATTVAYDSNPSDPSRNHNLLVVSTRDPLGNVVTVETMDDSGEAEIRNDYRVLQPYWVTDPNGNRTRVAFDALGLVAGTAVMGKPPSAPEEAEGDSLADFQADLTQAQIDGFHEAQDPHLEAADLLKGATTRIVYDVDRFRRTRHDHPDEPEKWQPAYAATLARETHVSDPLPQGGLKVQISFSYSDGFEREIQAKTQAEPGPVPKRDEDGSIILGPDGLPEMTEHDVSPRWVGSGWTVFNNKGDPVRQFEPFFTDRHSFEFDVRIGVSPVLFYDPLERVVATLHPNHSWERVVFDPWRQESWDVNDTVLLADPQDAPGVGDFFRRLPDGDYLPTWHALRTDPAHADAFALRYPDPALRAKETQAAEKTEVHAGTSTVAHLDTLGRTFLTVAHNRFERNGTVIEEHYPTRVELDIEGNQRAVRDAIVQDGDARGRVVMRYHYDLLGNRIHQASMEAGERWMLGDVAGNPIRAWDSRDHEFRTAYDLLRRPTESFLRGGAGAEQLVGRTVYGDTLLNPEAKNLREQVVQVFDHAGVVTTDEYDFKGNLLRSDRQLAREYKATLDWSASVPLETDSFTSGTAYDALNRPTELTAPDNSVIRPTYNEANLLERIEANLQAASTATVFVTDIDYNAKGQRLRADFGNGVRTAYDYDPLTFRLVHLKTTRGSDALQDLRYTYDPAGNITHIRDDAQQTIYFNNTVVEPHAEYTYDAIYRLIEATGREHLGQAGTPIPHSHDDALRVRLAHPGDGAAMGTYRERYLYDAAGNLLEMSHSGTDPAHPGWTRAYAYDEESLLEAGKRSNRLSRTTVQPNGNQPIVEPYAYDAHGNMIGMPHLPLMRWDFRDQLQATAQQVVNNGTPKTTCYVYDAVGQRVRKVTERQTPAGQTPARKEERIYLGGFEVYREYDGHGDVVELERETLHIMDDRQRIALVETRTQGSDPAPQQLIRYQLGNHLGSASLELDDQARILSYEEYTPYGSTAYQAVRNETETPKRYRYTGKERDEESGFYYHGARYYAPWLCRWTSSDPLSIAGGLNTYEYGSSNPVILVDARGLQASQPKLMEPWPYSDPVPNRASLGVNVQRDHPIQVSVRSAQRTAPSGTQYYSRSISTAHGELTILAETGRGRFHTEVGRLQAQIRQDVLAGRITSEAELLARTRAAYTEAAARTGATFSQADLDRVLLSNQAAVHRTTAQTAGELAGELGVRQGDFPSARQIDEAFSDPAASQQRPAGSRSGAGRPAPKGGTVGRVMTGIGTFASVAGSFFGGVQIGSGINQVAEGDIAMGSLDIAEGTTTVGITIGTTAGVKSGTLLVEGGIAAGGTTVAAGVAAGGSLALAFEETRRTLRGEKTMAAEAEEYWEGVQERAVAQGPSVRGALKYVGAEFARGAAGFIARGQRDLWGLLR